MVIKLKLIKGTYENTIIIITIYYYYYCYYSGSVVLYDNISFAFLTPYNNVTPKYLQYLFHLLPNLYQSNHR